MQHSFTKEALLNDQDGRKKITKKPFETPLTGNSEPEPIDPEESLIFEEVHEIIPDEDPDETTPYEPPSPGEGP